MHDEIFQRAKVTLTLAIGGAILWLLIGIPIGVISALKRRTWVDRSAMGFALVGVSAPVFWLGLVALYVFWQQLGWLPGTGYVDVHGQPVAVVPAHDHAVVRPRLLFAAIYARVTRGNMHRHDERGLHPHRPGEGPLRAAGGDASTACAPA